MLVGTDVDRIRRAAHQLLTDSVTYRRMTRVINPFGDGRAAERIVSVLASGRIDAALASTAIVAAQVEGERRAAGVRDRRASGAGDRRAAGA
jgi:hypothetical protein